MSNRTRVSPHLTSGFADPIGLGYIGIVSNQDSLYSTEPQVPNTIVQVYGHEVNGSREVLHYRYVADSVLPHDSGVVIVTASGKRWVLCDATDGVNLSYWKHPGRSWDQAFDGFLLWANNQGTTVPPLTFPYGTLTFTRPLILDNAKSYTLRGQRGFSNGTVLSFNIARSKGHMDRGAIDHWGSTFAFNSLQIEYLVVTGEPTVQEGSDDAGFAMCHGIKCRTTGAQWIDVKVQNFRGCGLWLDNAFDNAFQRVGVFACGRMKSGYDYNDAANVGNRDACEYPPIWIMSSRTGDASNFLRFYDNSIELNNCTPEVQIGGAINGFGNGSGGIQHHFVRVHGERPGRSNMPAVPRGTFLYIPNGEVWLESCGIDNHVNSIEYGNYVQMHITGCSRFTGDIIPIVGATGNGTCRIRISHSIIGKLVAPTRLGMELYVEGSIVGSMEGTTVSGLTSFVTTTFNGNVTIDSSGELGSAGGFKMTGCRVLGNVSATSGTVRVNISDTYINGDLSLLGNHSRQIGNQVMGTTTLSPFASTYGYGTPTTPATLWVNNSYSEIGGTVTRGTVIYKRTPVRGQSPGWICTASGTNGSGLEVAALPALGTGA